MPRVLLCECGECQRCKHRAYMNMYYRRPGVADKARERSGRYREAHVEEVRAKDRERGFRAHDPEKIRARNATRVLKRTPHDCEKCGAPNAQAHHSDYSRPLDVRWLCLACHGIEHRKVKG